METLEFVAETAGERIDALLPRIAADLTRSGAQRLIETGAVLVNGRPVQKSYKLAVGTPYTSPCPIRRSMTWRPRTSRWTWSTRTGT